MPTYFLSGDRQSVQEDPYLLQLKDGNLVTLWTDLHLENSFGVYMRFQSGDLSAGTPTPARVNNLTGDIQRGPAATAFNDGSFAVVFESRGQSAINGHDDAFYDSYIRFYNADGSARGAARQLTPNISKDHYASDIVTLSNGQSITLVVRDEGGGRYDLLAYRHGPGGAQAGQPALLVDNAPVYVNSWSGADFLSPSIAAGANGTYAVSWHQRTAQNGQNGYAIWSQVYRADGSALGPARVVAPVVPHSQEQFGLDQSSSELVGLTSGRWAMAWQRDEPNNVHADDVYFRLLNPNGTGATAAVLVNSDRRAGNQELQDVVDLGAGRTLVTYFHYIQDAIDGLFDGGLLMGRVFGPGGQAITGSFQVSEGTPYFEMTGGNTIINAAGQIVASFSAEFDYDTDVLGVVRPLTLPTVSGGARNDRITGTFVNDVIQGNGGADTLFGNRGNDQLFGGAGNDSLYGGAGNDRLTDSAGTNMLDGGAGNDLLVTGGGNDLLIGGAGADTLFGGAGNDRLRGGDGHDRLLGQVGADLIHAGAGNDAVIGNSGNDTLFGEAGNDDLIGDDGNDVLDGGAGNDLLRGGAGADRFIFSSGDDTIRNFDALQDVISLRSVPGLDSWADVRAQLVQVGNAVEFRHGGDSLRIEGMRIAQLAPDDFLW